MKKLSISIPEEVYSKLKDYSDSREISISDLLGNIIEKFIEFPDYDDLGVSHHEDHQKTRTKLKELFRRIEELEKRRKSIDEPDLKDESTKEDKVSEKGISLEREGKNTLPLSEIVISDKFLETPPRKEKVQEAIEEYKRRSSFDKPVVVRKKDMLLIDGYKRYMAAKELGLEEVQVKLI